MLRSNDKSVTRELFTYIQGRKSLASPSPHSAQAYHLHSSIRKSGTTAQSQFLPVFASNLISFYPCPLTCLSWYGYVGVCAKLNKAVRNIKFNHIAYIPYIERNVESNLTYMTRQLGCTKWCMPVYTLRPSSVPNPVLAFSSFCFFIFVLYPPLQMTRLDFDWMDKRSLILSAYSFLLLLLFWFIILDNNGGCADVPQEYFEAQYLPRLLLSCFTIETFHLLCPLSPKTSRLPRCAKYIKSTDPHRVMMQSLISILYPALSIDVISLCFLFAIFSFLSPFSFSILSASRIPGVTSSHGWPCQYNSLPSIGCLSNTLREVVTLSPDE